MSSKSKTKGNTWERDLCKFMTSIFGGSFTRVPSSGAIVGGKNNLRYNTLSKTQQKIYKGDLITPDFLPKFVIEAKFYKDFRFHQLLCPELCPQLETWIKQCLDAVDEDDFWVIIFKINLKGIYVAIPEKFINVFHFKNYASYNGKNGLFYITDMSSFFINNKDAIIAISS